MEVYPGVFVHLGANERPNKANGWAISNTGFIIGKDSVAVIDSGPSYQYALEKINYIKKLTNSKIKYLIITHHHPDHSMGVSKFLELGVEIIISKKELEKYNKYGERLLIQMKNLIGEKWFKNTSVEKLNYYVTQFPLAVDLGNKKIEVELYENAHSSGDLVVFDKDSNILFSGDLVFNQRAPTIPHANIPKWIEYLDQNFNYEWSKLIPGHGPIIKSKKELQLTRKWIETIHVIAMEAVEKGLSPAEVLDWGVPNSLSSAKLSKETWNRDIPVLMRKYEKNN